MKIKELKTMLAWSVNPKVKVEISIESIMSNDISSIKQYKDFLSFTNDYSIDEAEIDEMDGVNIYTGNNVFVMAIWVTGEVVRDFLNEFNKLREFYK